MNARDHWEEVYGTRSPIEVSWYQPEPLLSLQLIERAAGTADSPIIDVGGGASLLVDCLLARGYRNVAVLDIAESALRHARRRLGARAGAVEWYEQDVTTFASPHRFQVWHDRAVFHFLTRRADREAYVRAMRRALPNGGRVIIAAFVPGGPTRCSNLDVMPYDSASLAAELGSEFRHDESHQEIHLTPAGREQRFGYHCFTRVA